MLFLLCLLLAGQGLCKIILGSVLKYTALLLCYTELHIKPQYFYLEDIQSLHYNFKIPAQSPYDILFSWRRVKQ